MKKLLLILVLTSITDDIIGQIYFNNLYGYSSYDSIETAVDVIETADSGYVFLNRRSIYLEDFNEINITKIDRQGNEVWQNAHGLDSHYYALEKIIPYSDTDSMMIAGTDFNLDSASFFVSLLDPFGNNVWIKDYSNSSTSCTGKDMCKTIDGNWLICGFSEDLNMENSQWELAQMLVYKLNTAGDILWETTWGGSNFAEGGFSITETTDKGCLVAGKKVIPGGGDFIGLVVKFDSLGTFQWKKEFGIAIHNEAFSKIIPIYDGNYLLIGGYGYDGWDNPPTYISGQGGMMAKIDPEGNTLWFKKYEEEIQQVAFNDALEMSDHSIMVVGEYQTGGFASLLKFDEAGNLIWQQLYSHNPVKSERLYAVTTTEDNGFILAGQAFPIVPPNQSNTTDAWLLKVDSVGCPEPLCVPVPVAVDDLPEAEISGLQVYPNPANDEVRVTWNTSMPDMDRILRITNLQGKVVKFLLLTTTNGSDIISLIDIPAGSYYVSIGNTANNLTQKLIIIK